MRITDEREEELAELAEYIANVYCPDDVISPKIIADNQGISHCYGVYDDYFDGMLEHYNGRFHIYLNLSRLNTQDSTRSRFTFSHELGHFFIDEHRLALEEGRVDPHSSLVDIYSYDSNLAEYEANHFASNLLMPKSRCMKVLGTIGKGMNDIIKLSNTFETSLVSSAIRYIKLDPIPGILIK